MISSLRGEVVAKGRDWVEVEVSGVGYRVGLGDRLLRTWSLGDEVKVKTYMAVSDRDISLFGFETDEEVELFRMMIGVSGVGPKTAAAILGSNSAGAVIKAVSNAEEKDDLYLGLKQLGFSGIEIEKIVIKVPVDLTTVEDRLGWCLRNLG